MKTLVIAGTALEALRWINTDLQQRWPSNNALSMTDYTIVHSPDVLRGIVNPTGRFIGTWRDRPDIFEILNTLLVSTTPSTTKHKIIMNLLVTHIIDKTK